MAGPFPGMDPYLEDPVLWPGVHQGLITGIRNTLNQLLPPGYIADMGERIYVMQPDRSIYPDVAIFEAANLVVIDGYYHSAPLLAVEVLSPSEARAMIREKLDDYEAIGISEVWLISPEGRTVEVLLLDSGKYHRAALLAEGTLKPIRFPHVQIDIARIWPD